MKSLQVIQKTFRVFQILTKIAFVVSVVGALCVMTWYNGGQVLSILGEPITFSADREEMRQTLAVLLSDMVFLSTDAILLSFAKQYFKTEQSEGTPFTERGANLVLRLGVCCIWMPIVAIVIASVITVCLGVEISGDVSSFPDVVTGIVLIPASLIFRYGAELEKQNRSLNSAEEK